jgi:hypothetical protein
VLNAAPGLKADEKGVEINADSMGQFVLEVPELMLKDGKREKPVSTLNGDQLTVSYASGLALEYNVDRAENKIAVKFSKVPAVAKSLRFLMYVPMKFHQGGKYGFDGKMKEIPQAVGEQFLQQGGATTFTISDPMGESFTLTTPGGWQGLQDNRVFNWQIYVYAYHFDFGGRTEGYFGFSVQFAANSDQAGKFLVDRYGQSARKEYSGKVKSDEELKADVAREQASLSPLAGLVVDAYGGLAGSGEKYRLKKTGFFHVEKVQYRQVLVTPDGNLFFQLGVCGVVNCDDYTKVRGREKIYEWLPDAKGEFASAWRSNDPGVFSFQIANWIRKYGKPYSFDEWMGQTATRFRAWGFNSLGAFSSYSESMRKVNFPTADFISDGSGFGTKSLPDRVGAATVMDPFVPGTAEALDKAYAKQIAPKAKDPVIIGFFLGNEQHFENLPNLIPTYKSNVAAKLELVNMLRKKYGDIAKFNAAWQQARQFGSFDELKDEPLFVNNDAAAADMKEYFVHFMDTYYSIINTAFRKHDPNHMLIGSRWTPGTASNEDVVRIGGKYLDVVSVNYYTYQIERDFLQRVHEWSGRPIILSEWYFSSIEHGLGGGKEVRDQKERGEAYRNYVEQSAALPYVIGSQWFIYTDQSITGRFFEGFNGEGNNTGLADVTDRPYEDLIAACKQTHGRIYDVMMGSQKPYAYDDPRFTGAGGGGSKVVSVPKALPGMKMDGTTTNWPGRPAEPIEPGRLVLGKHNPKLRGDFRLCWDEQNLYFYIQVKDPTPMMNNHDGANLWNGDGIELFIGARNPNESGTLQYSDRQILLGAGSTPKIHIAGTGNEELAKECRIIGVKNVSGDGYVLEAVLPWKILGVPAAAGVELLFDVAIDNSDSGEGRGQQLMWNGTAGNSGDRGKWGRARLVEN